MNGFWAPEDSPAGDGPGPIAEPHRPGHFSGAGLFESLSQGWQVDELAATIGQESQARVAMVGLAGVGKRLLYNRLRGWVIRWPEPREPAADELRLDRLGFFILGDLPSRLGEMSAAYSLLQTPGGLLVALDDPALLVYLLDGTRGITQADYRWIAAIRTTGRPLVVALNKADLVADAETAALRASQSLGMPVIPLSALDGMNVEQRLLPAMLNAAPRLAVPLAREITGLRRNAARRVMRQAALFAGILGVQPVPGLELPFLVSLHVGVVLRIGAAFGHQPGGGIGREVIGTVGAVMALQYAAQTVAKFVPLLGSVVGGVLSALATFVIGETAIRYYEAGATLPVSALKASLPASLARLRRRRPAPAMEEIVLWPTSDEETQA